MWLLSAACDVYLSARSAGPVTPLSAAEIASWRAVSAELLPEAVAASPEPDQFTDRTATMTQGDPVASAKQETT